MQKKKVAIFGDSIFRGVVVDSERQKYTFSKYIDWQQIESELNVTIENFSKMGATINYGLAAAIKRLESGEHFDIAVVEYGGNDSDRDWKAVAANPNGEHNAKTSPEEFEKSLNQIIDLLQDNNIKVVLATIPPVSSLRYYNWIVKSGLNAQNLMQYLVDIETIARHQEIYNNIILKTAYRRSVDLIDVRAEFLQRVNYMDLMCEDGIHPNAAGANVIVDAFIKKYKKKLSRLAAFLDKMGNKAAML